MHMRRNLDEIKEEARSRGMGRVDKRDLIYLGILFALEDILEKIN